jgi:PadR family transcriptional regulator
MTTTPSARSTGLRIRFFSPLIPSNIFRKQHTDIDFEQVVLAAVASLDDAYGVTIRRKVEETCGEEVRFSAVYRILDHLEEKGYLTCWMADPVPERGGRAKRYYRLERAGHLALRQPMYAATPMMGAVGERI